MSDGYFRLHRSVMSHHLFASGRLSEREAWIWLIAEASYRDHKVRWRNQMIDIKRGQVPTSYRKMADAWGWGVNRVVNFLKLLKNEKMLDTATDTGFVIITICNYEKYQSSLTNSDTQPDTQSNTVTDTAADTNRIKGKERKRKNPPIVPPPGGVDGSVWSAYLDHRRQMRKPLTESAAKLLTKKLEGFAHAGHDPNDILNESIINGWQGVFAPKPASTSGNPVTVRKNRQDLPPGMGW